MSQKLNQAHVLNNPLSGISVENNDFSIEEIVAAMSQVQLKDIQISELHLEIDKLKNVDQSTQKIAQLEENIEELKHKIEDQEGSLTRRFPLIGVRHLIWDTIINSIVDFRPYLDMLEDTTALSCKSLHKCVVINETMLLVCLKQQLMSNCRH